MQILVIWLLFFGIIPFGNFANIFAIIPIAGKSHFTMFERLLKALAEKGHSVDVATHFPSKEVPSGYNQLSLRGSQPILVNNISVQAVDSFNHYDKVHFNTKIYGVDVCEAVLKTQVLQSLKNSTKKYDLVITHLFGCDCMLGFGHYFNAPIVSLISSTMLPWANDRIGNPDNPTYIPNYFVPYSPKMGFFERVTNTVILLFSKYLYHHFTSKDSNRISKEFFGEDLPSLEDLALNTSLILVNSHFSFSHPRPMVPNLIEVGGLHIQEPKPLSKYYENLLKTESKGIIYFTMGSMILIETFDYDKLQALFDAFAELSYKILWKATREKFPKGLKIPENIHFENWMPQMDILCHPNVKLFVSHGGLMGSQEAIYCGVPRLGIPLFSDQEYNIGTAERMGFAKKVSYKDLKKDAILAATLKLLNDPSFKENAEKVSRVFKDKPISPLDTAVYWVEYVIRHKGAPHLRSAGADLPWYQYYLIDIALAFILSFMFMVYVLIVGFRYSFRFVCNHCVKRKID